MAIEVLLKIINNFDVSITSFNPPPHYIYCPWMCPVYFKYNKLIDVIKLKDVHKSLDCLNFKVCVTCETSYFLNLTPAFRAEMPLHFKIQDPPH